jgi:hypothetical protein
MKSKLALEWLLAVLLTVFIIYSKGLGKQWEFVSFVHLILSTVRTTKKALY